MQGHLLQMGGPWVPGESTGWQACGSYQSPKGFTVGPSECSGPDPGPCVGKCQGLDRGSFEGSTRGQTLGSVGIVIRGQKFWGRGPWILFYKHLGAAIWGSYLGKH